MAADPDVCVVTLAPLDSGVSRGIAQARFRAALFGAIAALAVALACAGLYGVLAHSLSRLLDALLFGITSTDSLSFIFACAGLLALAAVASYLPARRAARLDPLVSLRAE